MKKLIKKKKNLSKKYRCIIRRKCVKLTCNFALLYVDFIMYYLY